MSGFDSSFMMRGVVTFQLTRRLNQGNKTLAIDLHDKKSGLDLN
jgi:hypothetical protein